MQLILFFNGWGMNESIISNIKKDIEADIFCINYPYKVPNINYKNYSKIFVIGWSFGVFYATKFLETFEFPHISIAINGTPFPIGEFGIPEKLFNLTLNTLNDDNFKKFFVNMGAPLSYFPKNFSIDKLKKELLDIKFSRENSIFKFNKVFLGAKDRIIPFNRQFKYFKDQCSNIKTMDCEHFPFDILNSWRIIISETFEF